MVTYCVGLFLSSAKVSNDDGTKYHTHRLNTTPGTLNTNTISKSDNQAEIIVIESFLPKRPTNTNNLLPESLIP